MQEDLEKSYLTLFEISPTLEYSEAQIARMREYLKQAQDLCVGRFEGTAKEYQSSVDQSQKALKCKITDCQRHTLHCMIQDARALKSQADVVSQHAIPVAYANRLAKLDLAAKSDLQVPLQVTVLNSKEVNAFALPRGFVFIERGLLEAAEDESQLAGVISHEMSHVVGRRGHKFMTKATIASLIYQAAQIAAVIFTGGAAGIGTYYALQYGFYGLG